MRRFYSSLPLAALIAALQPPAFSYALRGKRFVANAVGGTNSDTSTYSTSWDSSPFHLEAVTDNSLGLTAKTCAENYCHVGINGLDLWLSLEESCLNQQYLHPYLEEKIDGTGGGYRYKSTGSWSPGMSVAVCGLVMVVCTWIGYKLGSAVKPC